MQRNAMEQVNDLLGKATSILIALPHEPTVDMVSASVGLSSFLTQQGKKVSIAYSGHIPQHLDFLPQPLSIVTDLKKGDTLLVTLKLGEAELDQLSYVIEGKEVKIFLKPKTGSFSPDQVSAVAAQKDYDTVVVLGAHALDDLGQLYQTNAEFFYDTTKIVIDNDAANEYFGAVNFIDVSASGVSEIVFEICKSMQAGNFNKDTATSLMAGIVSNTHSFQDVRTTPKTLAAAAELIGMGADQQSIIVSLFKTKEFPLLKLWGRALARIKTDDELSLLYTALTPQDFEKTGTAQEQTLPVLREIIENVSGYQTVALLAQLDANKVDIFVAAPPHIPLDKIATAFKQDGATALPLQGIFQYITFTVPASDLSQVERQLIEAVRQLPR